MIFLILDILSASLSEPFNDANDTGVKYEIVSAFASLIEVMSYSPLGALSEVFALNEFKAAIIQNCLNSAKFSSSSSPDS